MISLKNLCVVAAALPLLVGCVDDNYDLSDIDTTIGVQTNDLIIPINIDEITLGSVIKTNDRVKIIDGQYAIIQDGSFTSQTINVGSIRLTSPEINSSETTISLEGLSPMSRAGASFSYNLANEGSEYRYESNTVSQFIDSICYIGCELTLQINVELVGLQSIVNRISFSDVVLQIPRGLSLSSAEGGVYDPKTGLLTIPDRVVTGNKLTVNLAATGVNFAQAGGIYNYDESTLSVIGMLYIKQGKASVAASDINVSAGQLPSSLTLRTSYNLSDAVVTSFSGRVKYDIANSHLTDVDLSDLPDVLSQHATDLTFTNPQIYLHITNPLQTYDMFARTGLKIEAFHGTDISTYELDNPYFQIGPGNADGIYNFCLSPEDPHSDVEGYTPYDHVVFTELSDVLSGKGIPDKLSIELVKPEVPSQKVDDFRLGTDLGSLSGTYQFIAPLQFGPGSSIVYADTIAGWSSEDLDYLTIRSLEVTMNVSTDIPVAVEFTGFPIDKDGNQIGNVEILGANIDAKASNQQVTLRITGEIRHLDGIIFQATATSSGGAPLSPDMTCRLTNIRPKVSGYYEKEL